DQGHGLHGMGLCEAVCLDWGVRLRVTREKLPGLADRKQDAVLLAVRVGQSFPLLHTRWEDAGARANRALDRLDRAGVYRGACDVSRTEIPRGDRPHRRLAAESAARAD